MKKYAVIAAASIVLILVIAFEGYALLSVKKNSDAPAFVTSAPAVSTVPASQEIAASIPITTTDWEAVSDKPSNYILINGVKTYFFIPDKHSTGIYSDSSLTSAEYNATYSGITVISGGDGTFIINFAKASNQSIPEVVTISNIDFSSHNIRINNEDSIKTQHTIRFVNCQFYRFYTTLSDSNIDLYFENCTFVSFVGCNATFERCQFRGDCYDGMNPFLNIQVNNCYFLDKSNPETEENVGHHTDGTQIYGTKDLDVQNIHFYNTRFEIPQLAYGTKITRINAPIMLQLQYSSGNNLTFTDCHLNGGGYSVYCWCKTEGLSLTNVKFKNISIGCHHLYGKLYPLSIQTVDYSELYDTKLLYATSVRIKDNIPYIYVTNDTNSRRTVLIRTDKGDIVHLIEPCPTYKEVSSTTRFDDFPFDVEFELPSDIKWVACFDVTSGKNELLCFVNITGDPVSLSKIGVEK